MVEVRCKNCDRLLLKASVIVAAIKCPRCNMIFEYHVYSNLMSSAQDLHQLEK